MLSFTLITPAHSRARITLDVERFDVNSDNRECGRALSRALVIMYERGIRDFEASWNAGELSFASHRVMPGDRRFTRAALIALQSLFPGSLVRRTGVRDESVESKNPIEREIARIPDGGDPTLQAALRELRSAAAHLTPEQAQKIKEELDN